MSARHRIKIAPSKPKPFAGTSALEVHAKLGVGMPCTGCDAPLAIVKFTAFVLLSDLTQEQRALIALTSGQEKAPTVDLKAGKAVMVGQVASCSRCRPTLERTVVAKGPSYAFIDVLEAPREVMVGAVSVPVGVSIN